jgi:hypothetical protein
MFLYIRPKQISICCCWNELIRQIKAQVAQNGIVYTSYSGKILWHRCNGNTRVERTNSDIHTPDLPSTASITGSIQPAITMSQTPHASVLQHRMYIIPSKKL